MKDICLCNCSNIFSFLHHLISDEKREFVILVIYSAGYVVFLELVAERLIYV